MRHCPTCQCEEEPKRLETYYYGNGLWGTIPLYVLATAAINQEG